MSDKVVGVIYETYDYGKFKKLKVNRTLTKSRLNDIKNSIAEKEIMNPIIVNANFEIIEGQGRFEAKKELGLPIYYIIDENATEEDCQRMNRWNTPWEIMDFVYSYSASGNEQYSLLAKTYEETKLPIARILRFANKGNSFGSNEVKDGHLRYGEADHQKVLEVKQICDDISTSLMYTRKPNEAFCTGVKVMCETEGYSHVHMIKNCKENRSSYVQMSRLEDQLKEFSRIYNSHLPTGKRLYFEDYMRNKGYSVRDYDDMFHQKYDKDDDVSTLEGK